MGTGPDARRHSWSFLGDAGVEAWIVNPTHFPTNLRFMVDDERRILEPASDEAHDRCRKADLCVIVDTAERSRVGKVSPLVDHLPTLVIDHHPAGGDAFEGASLRDNTAAAAGELVFDLLWSGGGPWTRSTVDSLYVALMTDTGSFRFSNVTSRVHRIVAELIERGASPDGLYRGGVRKGSGPPHSAAPGDPLYTGCLRGSESGMDFGSGRGVSRAGLYLGGPRRNCGLPSGARGRRGRASSSGSWRADGSRSLSARMASWT